MKKAISEEAQFESSTGFSAEAVGGDMQNWVLGQALVNGGELDQETIEQIADRNPELWRYLEKEYAARMDPSLLKKLGRWLRSELERDNSDTFAQDAYAAEDAEREEDLDAAKAGVIGAVDLDGVDAEQDTAAVPAGDDDNFLNQNKAADSSYTLFAAIQNAIGVINNGRPLAKGMDKESEPAAIDPSVAG